MTPALRSRGICAFLLARHTPGLSFGEPMRKMGQRAIVYREIFLDDVEVPETDRLGAEGQGFAGLMRTFQVSRVVLGAAAVGVARAAFDYARDYARTRTQFGRPIIEHQAVGFRLADMATRVEAAPAAGAARGPRARCGVRRAGRRAAGGDGQAHRQRDGDALHLGGGADAGRIGLPREHPVEQWMRDAKLEEIEEGTSDIMRLIIMRSLA